MSADLLPLEQETVLYTIAMYGGDPVGYGLPLVKVRDYSGIRGRALTAALNGLRLRKLAWRGASGHWHPTEHGLERGMA
jgi:hypothetical protein